MYSSNLNAFIVNVSTSDTTLSSRFTKGEISPSVIVREGIDYKERENDSLKDCPRKRLLSLYKREGKTETPFKKILRAEFFRRNSNGIREYRNN
jgi:hypothetical protein